MVVEITNIRKPLRLFGTVPSKSLNEVTFWLNREPTEAEAHLLYGAIDLIASKASGDISLTMAGAAALDLILGQTAGPASEIDLPEAAHPSMVMEIQCPHCLAPIKDGKYRNEALLAAWEPAGYCATGRSPKPDGVLHQREQTQRNEGGNRFSGQKGGQSISATSATGWHDIDTAPKDRFILLFCGEDESTWLAKWQGGEWFGVDDQGLTRRGNEIGTAVTGWFPIMWAEVPKPMLAAPSPQAELHRAIATAISRPQQGEPLTEMQRVKAICEALGFDPINHHNAAKCPYCAPAFSPSGELPEIKAWLISRGDILMEAVLSAPAELEIGEHAEPLYSQSRTDAAVRAERENTKLHQARGQAEWERANAAEAERDVARNQISHEKSVADHAMRVALEHEQREKAALDRAVAVVDKAYQNWLDTENGARPALRQYLLDALRTYQKGIDYA